MCIRRITHTLKCDVRPLATFTDAEKPIVNPWASPIPCRCNHLANPNPETQCPFGHRCCWMTISCFTCPNAPLCGGYSQYHVYEEVSHSKFDPDYTSWVAFDGNNARRDPDPEDRQYGSPYIEGWTPLPVVDERFKTMAKGTEISFMTMAFVQARDSLLNLAAKSYVILFDLQEARAQQEAGARHYGDHARSAVTARCVVPDEEACLSRKICDLEEAIAKTATEAAMWWHSVLKLSLNNEGSIEGLNPW